MRPASRPVHWPLTPAEQAQNDAEHQRGKEMGFLLALLLPMSAFLAPLAVRALQHFGWL